MRLMRRLSIVFCSVMWVLVAGAASAQQMIPPGWSQFNPPLPPPPPSPRIEVPVVPQMDVPSRPSVQRTPHTSFSDRIARCLDEGAAAGLGPSARAAYSRSCANR
jgi:hypothetical protein